MYPARITPIETTARERGSRELELPTRAVSTDQLANGSQGERTLPKTGPGYSSPEKDTIGSRREDSC